MFCNFGRDARHRRAAARVNCYGSEILYSSV